MTESTEVGHLGDAAKVAAITLGAEVDIQIATAKRYPRSISDAKQKLYELAAQDEKTAESMEYAVPRAGKAITGFSIRFAEIAAYSWGNLRVEDAVTGTDGDVVVAMATGQQVHRQSSEHQPGRQAFQRGHYPDHGPGRCLDRSEECDLRRYPEGAHHGRLRAGYESGRGRPQDIRGPP